MMIRKSGLIGIVIVPLVALVWLYVARNALVGGLASVLLERMLGSEVRLAGVEVEPFRLRAGFAKLEIVDAEQPGQFLLVAGPARFDVDGLQLFARKLIVQELQVEGLGLAVPRPDYVPAAGDRDDSAARSKKDAERRAKRNAQRDAQRDGKAEPGPGDSETAATDSAATDSAKPDEDEWNLDVPLPELDLSALEQELDVERLTGGQQLGSQRALDTATTGGEARLAGLQQRNDQLKAQKRLKDIQAKVGALKVDSKDPRELQAGLQGVREAAGDTKALRAEVQSLARDLKAEPGRIRNDFAEVDRQLDADVEAALRLAKLGGLKTGQVGALIFGPAVLERFNWVLAQFQRAREMLGSDEEPPRDPPRRAGRLIAFPVTGRVYPAFAVDLIEFTGATPGIEGAEPRQFAGKLTGLSSNAKVYGEPMRLEASASGAGRERWEVRGTFDHRGEVGQYALNAKGRAVRLGDLPLSGGSLPERATLRDADVTLQAGLTGSDLAAELHMEAHGVGFVFPPAGGTLSVTQRAVRDVFADFERVALQATLSGTLTRPSMKVSSSIDELFSRRMQAMLAQRQAEAEARVRAQIEQQIAGQRKAAQQALDQQRAELDASVRQAEERLRAYEQQLAQRQTELERSAKAGASRKAGDALQRARKR